MGRLRSACLASAVAVCATALGCATLRQGVGFAGIGVSMLRSPVTLRTRAFLDVNEPLDPEVRAALDAIAAAAARGEEPGVAADRYWPTLRQPGPLLERLNPFHEDVRDDLDGLEDLRTRDTLVLVALSGGGARAAVLAAHTLSLLEARFAELAGRTSGKRAPSALMDAIDAFSTVSGGSIYAYQVALRRLLAAGASSPDADAFRVLASSRAAKAGTRDLGFYTSVGYLAPANLFLPPLLTLTTDWSYLDLLAYGLSLSQSPVTRFFWPSDIVLGQLPARPLFLFNATALETGFPFVLTQRILHLPLEPRPLRSARTDVHVPACCRRPLTHALTLEEINSSPARFPLAYAAVASAAYPIGLEPLAIRKFAWNASAREIGRTADTVQVADGGIFDHTGLNTAVDLIEYLAAPRAGGSRVRHVVLLAVNAETSPYDPEFARRPPSRRLELPVSIDGPVRGLGLRALNLLHATSTWNAQEFAWQRLRRLQKSHGVEVHYFPVSLIQLSDQDAHPVPGGAELFARVQDVSTSYTLSRGQDETLATAAAHLLRGDRTRGGRRPELGWRVGPDCADGSRALVGRLEEAFAYAVLRAEAARFDAPLAPGSEDRESGCP